MFEAKRIKNLPPYLFAEIDKKIAEKKSQGIDVISLGIGDPDQPTPKHIVDTLCQQAKNKSNHRYPSYYGMPKLRKAITDYYQKRFGIELDPDSQALPLIGSKEGLAHILVALLDPGDIVLVPDPGYPVYGTGTLLAGGEAYFMPLLEENNFLPKFQDLNPEKVSKAKAMFLSYPNNPTSAVANKEFFSKAVDFARNNNIVILHDNPYSEITYDGFKAPSFLEVDGAIDIGIEFNSLSKTYNMTGWRIGYAVGNNFIIDALSRVKTNIDSGIFNAIQYAGIEALEGDQESVDKMRQIYKKRRDFVIDSLKQIGIELEPPKATIYIWVPVPDGYTSTSFATKILDEAGVVVSPGNAYGPTGEGYIRITLTVEDDRLKEAMDRIKEIF